MKEKKLYVDVDYADAVPEPTVASQPKVKTSQPKVKIVWFGAGWFKTGWFESSSQPSRSQPLRSQPLRSQLLSSQPSSSPPSLRYAYHRFNFINSSCRFGATVGFTLGGPKGAIIGSLTGYILGETAATMMENR